MFKVLASRIIIFAMAILWVVGWLFTGIVGLELFTFELTNSGLYSWVATFLQVWYIATIVLVGIWVAARGFKFVGKWEKDES